MNDERAGLRFGFTFARGASAARPRDDDAPFRILVLTDLGGGSETPGTPIAVDIDNFDRVFARIAPRLALPLDGATLEIAFGSLEDFHPDRLFARLAPFQALRALRAELADPDRYAQAVQALGGSSASAPAAEGAGADDIERLLGRKASSAAASGSTEVAGWIRSLVAPFVRPDIAQEQKQWLATVDAAVGEQMRRVLHHPAFQALEASWRGIDRLVRELELGETLQLSIADAPRAVLQQDIAGAGDDLAGSALYRHLCGPATEAPRGHPWSVLAVGIEVGPGLEDLRLLAALGALAGQAGAPLLAGAQPGLLGAGGPSALTDRSSWAPPEDEAFAAWHALRRSGAARWIGLALPRLLLRLPYGAATDPVDSMAFEELPPSRDPQAYLWGNPALGLALAAGRAFAEEDWALSLDGAADLGDLPTHSFRVDGEVQQQPGTEAPMSEAAGEAALARGVMPLLAFRNGDVARLPRWQSIADPAAALEGPWRG